VWNQYASANYILIDLGHPDAMIFNVICYAVRSSGVKAASPKEQMARTRKLPFNVMRP
jgi:hypothetical protein